MEFVESVAALTLQNLPFYTYTWEFCELAAATTLPDTTIIEMFRLGATFHRSIDLPDTTGLCWREAILRCLGSVRARAGTNSSAAALPCQPLSPTTPHQPPSAATASPPTRNTVSPPRSMASPLVPSSPPVPPLVLSSSLVPPLVPSSSSRLSLSPCCQSAPKNPHFQSTLKCPH